MPTKATTAKQPVRKAQNLTVAEYVAPGISEGIQINGRDVFHVKNGKAKRVTLAESAAIFAKLEVQFGFGSTLNDCNYDNGRDEWLKQVAQVLKDAECSNTGPDGSTVRVTPDGYYCVSGPMAESFKILATSTGKDPETLILSALREGLAGFREQAAAS